MAGSVLDQAQNFSGGVVSAARQRDRWARREANATDDEQREQYREAIADLTARYPDLEEIPIGGAEGFAKERGHGRGSRSPVHEGRRRPATSQRNTPRDRAKAPAGTKKPSAAKKPRAKAVTTPKLDRGRSTPRVDRAIRDTGIPDAVSTGGSTLMKVLGATVGLSLGYLVVSSAEKPGTGAAALPSVVRSITRGLGRFLDPEKDLFPSSGGRGGGAPNSYPEGPGTDIHRAAERLRRGEVHVSHPGKFKDARPGTYDPPAQQGQKAHR